MLTLPDGETVLGELVDLSVGGAGIILHRSASRLPRGTRVAVLLEAEDLPDPNGEGAVISVRAVIASVAPLGKAPGQARFGLEFTQAVRGLDARIAARQAAWPLADGTGANVAVDTPGQELAKSPHGREILFQHARACLAKQNPEGALQAMNWALGHVPAHVAYGVVRLQALAEQALALGDRAAARNAVDAALALSPGHPDIVALQARVGGAEPAAKKGLFGRFFSR
jgi:PilZ domain